MVTKGFDRRPAAEDILDPSRVLGGQKDLLTAWTVLDLVNAVMQLFGSLLGEILMDGCTETHPRFR